MQISSNVFKGSSLAAVAFFLTACSNVAPETNSHTFGKASVDDVKEALLSDNVVVIDARSPDAFNGWVFKNGKLDGDDVGGHIPGAELFSARWIEQQQDGLDRGYQYARLDENNKAIIYGYDKTQAKVVADWLVNEQGWDKNNIQLLKDGIAGWTEQKPASLDYLPGFQTLVPLEYVSQVSAETPDVKVVQIGWDGNKARDYRKEHIPGAVYWDDIEFEMPPIWENRPVDVIRTSLKGLGIDKNTSVIVYSTESIMAARAAVVMKYAGVKDVVVMNGNMDLWTKSGLTTESGWNEPLAIDDFGVTGAGDNSVVIDIDEAKKLREQPDSALVSIRSWREYTGQVSGYDYFQKRGRIQGALWGHAGNSSWNMDHYHNPDNTMRNYKQIAEFWADWNITPDMNLSFYCGNGARASEVWWYAQAMGYTNSTVYTSGWMRWRNDENARASGELTKEEALAEWRAVSGTEESQG